MVLSGQSSAPAPAPTLSNNNNVSLLSSEFIAFPHLLGSKTAVFFFLHFQIFIHNIRQRQCTTTVTAAA
jgi:hypothetical protein